jgi:hypothetical protein
VRYLVAGFYTIDQNERAVLTSFGRAHRLGDQTTAGDPISESLRADEKERYAMPVRRSRWSGRGFTGSGRGSACTRFPSPPRR